MKKEKITYHSFIENKNRYMQCKKCFEYTKTSEDSISVTCGRCTAVININKYPDTLPKSFKPSGKPPGWHFMKEFVDKDGNVFHKGVEQPDLKGTLKPTKIKVTKRKKKKKLTADEKLLKDISDYKKKQKIKRKQNKK